MQSETNVPATRFQQEPNLETRFPPLPKTVSEVSTVVDTANSPDTRRLAEIVHADPVTAALVLRRINSAYYGLRRRFSNVQQAVALLGFLEVCDIVLTAGMLKLRDALSSDEQLVIFDRIMRVSMGSAFYARRLATVLNLPTRDHAFTASLLHAVGRLVFLYNRPSDYEALWYTQSEGHVPSALDERLIFGTDHAEVGAFAAEQWNLPLLVADTIRSYLDPESAEDPDVRLLALTLLVSTSIAEQLCLHTEEPDGVAFEVPDGLDVLVQETSGELEEVVEVLRAEQPRFYAYLRSMS